jgi:hypothetical protein
MTWILPKQLHTSAFVPDMAALTLDSSECSQICEQSLLARSKATPARTWLRKWKRDNWTRHLSGRILKPSHGEHFTAAWTSSLAVIPASHSAAPESALVPMIPATSGPTSQQELPLCGPESVSLKTSRDTFLWDSKTSCATYKDLVTLARSEYSARLRSGRPTSASESSSWPTASVAEAGKISCQPNYGQTGLSNHPAIVGVVARAPQVKSGKAVSAWPTPAARDYKDTGNLETSSIRSDGKDRTDTLGRVVHANSSIAGSRHEQWMTPEAKNSTGYQNQPNGTVTLRLGSQVKSAWARPCTRDHMGPPGAGFTERGGCRSSLPRDVQPGKLNPRWVETLMGVPVGWTMASCAVPVTIEPTNSDFSATASSPPLPPAHGWSLTNASVANNL